MKLYTITYTKTFTADSLLAGIQITEVERDLRGAEAVRWVSFLRKAVSTPVNACGGSNYTVSDIEMTEQR